MKAIVVVIAFILAFPLTIAVLTGLIAVTGLGAGIAEMAIILIIAAIVGYFVARAVSKKQKP
ncbi:hypothetical protein [Corynebacterium sp.]|uniref:hypothetical protein n=1 Tax=Corynebacterium sp. TaxID=1720 RepID=UPI0028AACFDF|nr:hypothetical protein [Corynebacterium sp.]